MRTKENIDIATLKFDGFKSNLKKAIEYASGSPFKKESKLNEACAIALGFGNSDRWASAKEQANLESADALTLAKQGLCPFTRLPMDHEVAQGLGTTWEVKKDESQLLIHQFPKGMRIEDRAIWNASQPKGTTEMVVEEPTYFPGGPIVGSEPHLHAAIAGYRSDANSKSWFMSYNSDPGEAAYTVAYWHTNFPEFAHLPLAERLQYETHYELVVSFMDDSEIQLIHLYRIFKIGDSWQLSQDSTINPNYYNRDTGQGANFKSPELSGLLNCIIEGAVTRPNEWAEQGADVQNSGFPILISKDLEDFFENNPSISKEGVDSKTVMKFIQGSLKTLEGPVMFKSRMNDPVMHPVG